MESKRQVSDNDGGAEADVDVRAIIRSGTPTYRSRYRLKRWAHRIGIGRRSAIVEKC